MLLSQKMYNNIDVLQLFYTCSEEESADVGVPLVFHCVITDAHGGMYQMSLMVPLVSTNSPSDFLTKFAQSW